MVTSICPSAPSPPPLHHPGVTNTKTGHPELQMCCCFCHISLGWELNEDGPEFWSIKWPERGPNPNFPEEWCQGGGTHIWKWQGCADTTPKVGVFWWQTKQRKLGVFQWGQKKNRGSFGEESEDYKKKGSFSEDFSLKKKRGSFCEALNLSAKFYLATT